MKRTPLRRKTPLARGKKGLRRTRIRRMSKELAIENGHYLVERAIYLRDHPYCEAEPFVAAAQDRAPRLKLRASHVHHKKGRKGKLLRDQTWWCPVAADNHQYIEDHKRWARSVGLILYR